MRRHGRGCCSVRPQSTRDTAAAMEDLETSLADVSVEEKCYRIAKNSELGRHVVVTRNLKKGDIIFKDYPLVTAPSRESTPCCVACYRLLGMVPSLSFERVLDRYICCHKRQNHKFGKSNNHIYQMFFWDILYPFVHSYLSIKL